MEEEPHGSGEEVDPQPKRRSDRRRTASALELGQEQESVRQEGGKDESGDDHAL